MGPVGRLLRCSILVRVCVHDGASLVSRRQPYVTEDSRSVYTSAFGRAVPNSRGNRVASDHVSSRVAKQNKHLLL